MYKTPSSVLTVLRYTCRTDKVVFCLFVYLLKSVNKFATLFRNMQIWFLLISPKEVIQVWTLKKLTWINILLCPKYRGMKLGWRLEIACTFHTSKNVAMNCNELSMCLLFGSTVEFLVTAKVPGAEYVG